MKDLLLENILRLGIKIKRQLMIPPCPKEKIVFNLNTMS
jgi:hypothetical protein